MYSNCHLTHSSFSLSFELLTLSEYRILKSFYMTCQDSFISEAVFTTTLDPVTSSTASTCISPHTTSTERNEYIVQPVFNIPTECQITSDNDTIMTALDTSSPANTIPPPSAREFSPSTAIDSSTCKDNAPPVVKKSRGRPKKVKRSRIPKLKLKVCIAGQLQCYTNLSAEICDSRSTDTDSSDVTLNASKSQTPTPSPAKASTHSSNPSSVTICDFDADIDATVTSTTGNGKKADFLSTSLPTPLACSLSSSLSSSLPSSHLLSGYKFSTNLNNREDDDETVDYQKFLEISEDSEDSQNIHCIRYLDIVSFCAFSCNEVWD